MQFLGTWKCLRKNNSKHHDKIIIDILIHSVLKNISVACSTGNIEINSLKIHDFPKTIFLILGVIDMEIYDSH